MAPKKKIAELSKKKIENEIKKHKNALKERSPLEKAKRAYHTEVKETSKVEDTKDIEKAESSQKQLPEETKSEVYTPDLSKKIDSSYEKLQRTSRGLAAAASVFVGETLGIDTSAESEDSESQPEDIKKDQSTAVALARKILERKKGERRNSTE
ncbi:MAG: hypothetical protein ACE5I5_17385 [Candidatus Heimdallarchaeota archaeon]